MDEKANTPPPIITQPRAPERSSQPEVGTEHDTTLKWFIPAQAEALRPTAAVTAASKRLLPQDQATPAPEPASPASTRPPEAAPSTTEVRAATLLTTPSPPTEATVALPPPRPTRSAMVGAAPPVLAPLTDTPPPPPKTPAAPLVAAALPVAPQASVGDTPPPLPKRAAPTTGAVEPVDIQIGDTPPPPPKPARPIAAPPTVPAVSPTAPAEAPNLRRTTPPPLVARPPQVPTARASVTPVAAVPAGAAVTNRPTVASTDSPGATPTDLVMPDRTPPQSVSPAEELGAAPVAMLPGSVGSDAELTGDAVELLPASADDAALSAGRPWLAADEARAETSAVAPLTKRPQPSLVSEPREVEPEAIEMVESNEHPTSPAEPKPSEPPSTPSEATPSRPPTQHVTPPALPATAATTPPAAKPQVSPAPPVRIEPAQAASPPPVPAEPSLHVTAPSIRPEPSLHVTPPPVRPEPPAHVTPPPVRPEPPAHVTPPPVRPEAAAQTPPPPTAPPVVTKLVEEPSAAATSDEAVPEALARRSLQKRSKPWYEEIFDEDYLRTLPFSTPPQTQREADFIREALGVAKGAELLDIGCGYGRHALELAQQGFRVTGLDLSLPLLIRAADDAQRRGLAVNFVHADMREMTFNGQFDAAYCVLSSFGYFDEETNLRVATQICKAIKPGGRFLIDLLSRDYIVGDLPSRVWWEGDGCVVLEEVDFNFHTSRVLVRRSIVFGNGRQSEQEISVRAYSLHELGKLLRQAGLRVVEVSGGLATKSRFFGAASRNIIAVCERPVT